MKKLRTLFTLLVVSFCAVQSAWADRVAPVLPTTAQTLESGQSYYLYNVMEGKFACQSTTNTSYVALGTYGEMVTITATDNEGEYTIQWASNNYSWAIGGSSVSTSYSWDWQRYFIVAESSKGYTIQCSPRNTICYKADEYVGFNGSNGDRLNSALAEGSIHWQLMSVDDAEYYFAKHKLYTYLEVADQYNFYVTQYDLVYNNNASTTAELDFAQATLKDALDISQNYISPSWSEYPIFFKNSTENKWSLTYDKKAIQRSLYDYTYSARDETSTLVGTVNVDADATFVYTYEGNESATMQVYLDGEIVQIITPNQSGRKRYYIELTAGKHDITWTYYLNIARATGGYDETLSEIGVLNTPTITPATTTVEGQLGTEVLKLVDPVSSVKKIVINGVIGADDWTTIGLMANAFSIDMSGATATTIPNGMFTKEKFPFLHDIKLPQGLKEIGESAFYESDVENELILPETMEIIGEKAFFNSKIKSIHMPDGITSIGRLTFYNCYFLENITFPSSAGIIPEDCFRGCCNLRTFTIPEGITEIGEDAFNSCELFNARFPSTLKTIKGGAFRNTAIDNLVIPEDATVYNLAFADCKNLIYAEWPTSFSYAYKAWSSIPGTTPVVSNCPKLTDVMLKSPTVVTYNSQDFFEDNTLSNINLHVPDFLVNAYKLDPYWYQCNVVGFNSADIEEWNITKALTLNAGLRIGGTPNLRVKLDGNITVNGSETQNIGNLCINYSPISYDLWLGGVREDVTQQWGMMLSNSDNVNVTGELNEILRTKEKTWYFLTLPFDTKVGNITTTSDESGAATSFAIRYYDGATRATNGSGGNWKNYNAEDIIPAGTGFIYQTAKAASSKFVAQNNATKQYIVSNREFVKALDANTSEVTANKGWNLIGNPWQTYYNIHKLNFTAPITVWDMSNNKYVAYSIIDDDYAIKPLEAIFVQCPDEINSISFPIDGRQLTTEIESQNGARALVAEAKSRQLIDIELSDGEQNDKTRIVMNPLASVDYEINCDASKFFSMDPGVPQIFSIEDGTQYAINERPADNGIVSLGVLLPADGTYTLSVSRNDLQNVVLYDKQTGRSTDICTGSYTFNGDAGLYEDRFELRFSDINGISDINRETITNNRYYNLNGQRINEPQKGLYVLKGKKVVVK